MDEENIANFRVFQTIVDEIAVDSSHVLPVWDLIQDRKGQKALTASRVASETFTNVTTFASLPDEFKVTWIVQASDLTAVDLGKLMARDPGCVDVLMSVAIQINPKTKLPSYLLHKEVMKEFMDLRHEQCGSPLSNFKARGGLKGADLDLEAAGSYTLEYKDDKVIGVTHRSGAKGTIGEECGFNRAWSLVANHDDHGAHLILPPGPPHLLFVYFGEGSGPKEFKSYVGKPKELTSDAKALFDAWEAKKFEATGGAGGSSTVEAIKQLQDAKKRKKTAVLEKAREAGRASAAAKVIKSTIKLRK